VALFYKPWPLLQREQCAHVRRVYRTLLLLYNSNISDKSISRHAYDNTIIDSNDAVVVLRVVMGARRDTGQWSHPVGADTRARARDE